MIHSATILSKIQPVTFKGWTAAINKDLEAPGCIVDPRAVFLAQHGLATDEFTIYESDKYSLRYPLEEIVKTIKQKNAEHNREYDKRIKERKDNLLQYLKDSGPQCLYEQLKELAQDTTICNSGYETWEELEALL